MEKAVKGLKAAGKELYNWIQSQYDAASMEQHAPLVRELCELADRLAEVRASIAKQGVSTADGKKNPLLDTEIKLSAMFTKDWRVLGLADRDAAAPRPVGRPPANMGAKKWA